MTDTSTCSLCQSPSTASICANCGAQNGYRDGKGVVRSKAAFVALGLATTFFAVALLWLASQIPLWYYFYPLLGFGVLFALGTVIVTVMLIRGPKWYPAP